MLSLSNSFSMPTTYTYTKYLAIAYLAFADFETITTPLEVWFEYEYLKGAFNTFILDEQKLPFWVKIYDLTDRS